MSRAHSTLVSGNMSDELLENDPAGLGLIALPPVFSKFDINQVIRYSEIELIAPTFATSPEPELPEVVYTSQAVGAREVQIGEVQIGEVEVEEVIDDGELLGGELLSFSPASAAAHDLAERLETIARRLRRDGTAAVVAGMRGDRFDALLAGLFAGYLAAREEDGI